MTLAKNLPNLLRNKYPNKILIELTNFFELASFVFRGQVLQGMGNKLFPI